jgi:matrix metalloproteinase-20 (enamelysin)
MFLFFFFILLLGSSPCLLARNTPGFTNKEVAGISERFLNAARGSEVAGISEFKKHFRRFGYLPLQNGTFLVTDTFDDRFESAVTLYQEKLGLPTTGKLDLATVSQVSTPRCGVPDTPARFHGTKRYVYFPGKPRWYRPMPMTLTYGFSPVNFISSLSSSDIKVVFKRAFATWASVIPVSFVETEDYAFADIKLKKKKKNKKTGRLRPWGWLGHPRPAIWGWPNHPHGPRGGQPTPMGWFGHPCYLLLLLLLFFFFFF